MVRKCLRCMNDWFECTCKCHYCKGKLDTTIIYGPKASGLDYEIYVCSTCDKIMEPKIKARKSKNPQEC